MKVHELQVTPNKDRKRLGRGIGSGTGKTAGRGTKGQKARTGGGVTPGFAGGQTRLSQQLPKKRGFKPHGKVAGQIVNLSQLEKVKGATVDAKALVAAGIIDSETRPVKLLGNGEVKKAFTVKVSSASKSAEAAVKKAGGKLELLK